MAVDLDIIEEMLPYAAVALGFLQGKLDAKWVGHEVIDHLDELGALDTSDLTEKVDLVFSYLNESAGTENLLSVILTLMGTGVITIDTKKTMDYFEPIHDTQGEMN